MFLEILIALLLGVLAGCFTGLTPGVHVNLVSVMVLGASGFFLGFVGEITIAVFIISMAVTHTFLDAIPSIFLGAPDSEMVLGVLPGHRMLLRGEGYQAVKLTVIGSFFGLVLAVGLIPILIPVVTIAYTYLEKVMGWVLLGIVVLMIWGEKKRLMALGQFLLAGTLGLVVFNFPGLEQPLLPMLSGLFGIATLVLSLNEKVKIPEQKIGEVKMEKGKMWRGIIVSVFSGGIVALLPGLGSAQAGILGNYITGDLGDKGFLVLIGGINTVNMVVSLMTFYALDKARNGPIVIVREILEKISFGELMFFLGVCLVVGALATMLTLVFTKKFTKWIVKVNYQKLCYGLIIFVSLLAGYFSGVYGLMVLAVSSAIGIIPALVGVKRSLNMGCLLLPVIVWFLV